LKALVEEERVVTRGYGTQVFRAVTVGDRLEALAEAEKAAAKEAILESLVGAGLQVSAGWRNVVTMSMADATTLLAMFEAHPRIVRKFFTPIEDGEE